MRTLQWYSSNPEVEFCQHLLQDLGFVVSLDGDFGPQTQKAVCQFQATAHLNPDGIVGPKTWAALLKNGNPQEHYKAWLADQIPEGTPAVASRALRNAISYVGAKEQPDGSNSGPQISALVDGYNEYWGLDDNEHRPWCVMALSSWIAQALDLPQRPQWGDWPTHPWHNKKAGGGAFLGSVRALELWAAHEDAWGNPDLHKPWAAGACFTMSRSLSMSDSNSNSHAGHAGFIIKDRKDGSLLTVEGNVGNSVQCLYRLKSTLHGWIVWW